MPTAATSSRTKSKAVTSAKKTSLTHEPRNFLATFLLTAAFAPLGLRHFYLGDRRLGWIRVGLFIGGGIWMSIFAGLNIVALALVGWLAFMTASIWGVVDFFYVYFSVRHDATGKPLVASSLDRRFATIIFWITVGFAALCLMLLVIGLSIGQSTYNDWSNSLIQPQHTPSSDWPPQGYYQ